MCSNYNLNGDRNIKDQQVMKRGGLWKQICTISDKNKAVADVVTKGLVKKMGNGTSTVF